MAWRSSVVVACLSLSALTSACGGSQSSAAQSPTAAASQRLQGNWRLLTFQPNLAFEEPLKGLLDAQLKTLAITFTGGAKYLIGQGTVRPYVGGGAGIVDLKRTITEARIGDVTAAVFNDFAVGQPDLSLESEGVTRPLIEATLGAGIFAGRTYVDLGYRYRRAFRLDPTLDFSQFTIGVGYKF